MSERSDTFSRRATGRSFRRRSRRGIVVTGGDSSLCEDLPVGQDMEAEDSDTGHPHPVSPRLIRVFVPWLFKNKNFLM